MNDQLAAPRATETQAPPSNWWDRYTFAELSGVISLSALFCGLAYDGAYFSEIEPRFFHLLSLHDHIDSAISFLPLTLLMLLIGSVHSKLFMDIEDRQKSLVAIIAYISPLIPKFARHIMDRAAKRHLEKIAATIPNRNLLTSKGS
jgi:hypothetical protein